MFAFRPYAAATVNIDVSASSQRVLIGSAPDAVRIHNGGTATGWVNFGDGTVTAATATGIPIPAGAIEVVSVPSGGAPLYVAAIAAGSTGKIYFTPGSGI